MTIITAGRVQISESAERFQSAAFLATDGTELGITPGVHAGLVLSKTSGMGFSLGIGRGAIAPATVGNGPVLAAVTVAEAGTFANGDATRDRIDLVVLQVDETATTGNGLPPVTLQIVQGAYPVSGSPVPPAAVPGQLGLWQVKIAAGTSAGGGGWNTANLVDVRPPLYTPVSIPEMIRVQPGTIAGTLASGGTAALAAGVTVPVNPFGVGVPYVIEVYAQTGPSVPSGLGVDLIVQFNGVPLATSGRTRQTQSGTTAAAPEFSVRAALAYTPATAVAVTVVVNATALAGTITWDSPATPDKTFVIISVRPARVF